MPVAPDDFFLPACPYLGANYDQSVHFGYASLENACYATQRPASIQIDFQETHCLGGRHSECPRYQKAKGITPSRALGSGRRPPARAVTAAVPPRADLARARRQLFRQMAIAAGLLLVLALLTWLQLSGPRSAGVTTRSPTPALALATRSPAPATATSVPTATPLPSPTPSAVPTSTATASTAPTSAPPDAAPYVIAQAARGNLREGPGIDYAVIGTVTRGQRLDAAGRNEAGDWVEACCVNGNPGWLSTQIITVSVPVETLPVLAAPPPG